MVTLDTLSVSTFCKKFEKAKLVVSGLLPLFKKSNSATAVMISESQIRKFLVKFIEIQCLRLQLQGSIPSTALQAGGNDKLP